MGALGEKELSRTEVVLLCAIAAVSATYAYFFIILPQFWTLRDDYVFAIQWGQHSDQVWRLGTAYLKKIMSEGRFQPIDVLNRIVHYGYLPLSARIFRISYFFSASLAVWGLVRLLREFDCGRTQILFAVLLVVSNLAFKEWLTTLTVSEALGALFFVWGFYFFSKKNGRWGWAAAILFPLSFCSKESFSVLACAFPIALFFKEGPRRRWGLCALLLLEALAFLLFVRGLPRVYTAGLSFRNIHPAGVAKSFLMPPLRSFGPALVPLLLSIGGRKTLSVARKSLLWSGAAIVAAFTLFINAWGPFDSWFYLHTIVPFGWAMVFAALLDERSLSRRIGFAAVAAAAFYQLLSAVNGSRNYYDYFLQSRQAADFACHEWKKDRSVKIASNCYEGSSSLRNYLLLEQRCPEAFSIQYFLNDAGRAAKLGTFLSSGGHKIILHSKYCDEWEPSLVDVERERAGKDALMLGAWTILETH